jgi:hypothetical protein
MNKLVIPFFVGLFTLGIGFSASQMLATGPTREKISEHEVRITSNEKAINTIVSDVHIRWGRMSDDVSMRIAKLVDLVISDRESNKEFLNLLKSQNELLMQQTKQNAELIHLLKDTKP